MRSSVWVHSTIVGACALLSLTLTLRASRADLPSAPDGHAWATIPDRSKKSMEYAASQLAKVARHHGMNCSDVLADGILRCDINFGIAGSFVASAGDDKYEILLFFGQRDSSEKIRGNAALFAVLDDYGRRVRKRRGIGEVGLCRAPWVDDWQGASVCIGGE
jgi:hypothetical protein